MTNLAFFAKDKDGLALFLVRFYERDGQIKSSTTYAIGNNDHAALPKGSQLVVGWVSLVLRTAQLRVAPYLVHHYEVVCD